MVRDHLAPRLRDLGFRGSGQSWILPSDSAWAVLGIQKSKWSTSETVEFAVNTSVISRAEWDRLRKERPHFGERPRSNMLYGPQVWMRRFRPAEDEKLWWEIKAQGSVSEIATQVATTIERRVLPAMREAIGQASR
jgi:Domain of unknown function (DUF4304)